MSDFPAHHPRRHSACLVVLPALILGVMVGALGTMTCKNWAPNFAEATGMDFQSWRKGVYPAAGLADQGRRHLFKVFNRDVWVYHPAKAAKIGSRSLPAVIVLHGSEDTALHIAKNSSFEEVAELSNNTFLAVFPEMAEHRGMSWGYKDDEQFFRAVVDLLDKEFLVKRDEIYICGHSAGGTMSLYLQNNVPDIFRGAAAIEAGVGHEEIWNLSSAGKPTMLVWNNNDPVLKDYDLKPLDTIRMLRRHDTTASGPSFIKDVPLLNHSHVRYAKKVSWGAVGSTPPTTIISWATKTPTHLWSNENNIPGSFDASKMVWEFFLSIKAFDQSQKLEKVQL